MEELDFIAPKKIVGKMISVDVLDEIRAKIAAKIGGNGSENDGLDKALAIIDEYIRENEE